MKLIVGLGNPGKEYNKTRHNCGFMAIDYYNNKYNLKEKNKFNGLYTEQIVNNEKIILLKPQTYMNLSGNCVVKFVNYYNIDINDIIIIYDDVDYPLGTIKIKKNGSSGGHNGIKSIINILKNENIKRIRIGISKNSIPIEEYVLQKFTEDELKVISSNLETICEIIDSINRYSIDEIMNKYNGIKE